MPEGRNASLGTSRIAFITAASRIPRAARCSLSIRSFLASIALLGSTVIPPPKVQMVPYTNPQTTGSRQLNH
uniref:Uncharacterized protein n=1 Tax=Citrifermentans bremense TaxID=60035 RepID=A0A6S6M9H4_9BACT